MPKTVTGILHEWVEKHARDTPHAPVFYFKNHKWIYRELQEKIEKLAAALAARGLRTGDAYGLVMRNCPEFVVTFFALARLGVRAVPVNFLLKPDEIAYIFGNAGVRGVVTQPAFQAGVLDAKRQLPLLKEVIIVGSGVTAGDVLDWNAVLASAPAEVPPPARDARAVVMIIYTSGTTGKPKGAMLTHTNFAANVEQCTGAIRLSRKDVFLCLLPMFHSFAWTTCVLTPLHLGTPIVIVESIQPFSEVLKRIFKHRVTLFVGVPPLFAAMLRIPFWRPLKIFNPIRACISGAAALPIEVQKRFEDKFGIPILEGYGLTEASPVLSLNPIETQRYSSVGKPLPGVEIRIVGEDGKDIGTGEVGEICAKGENIMPGYYKDETATRESFLDPDTRQWLKTGDLGFLDQDGYLFISDRKKDLIIVKGLNVYPKEIEDVLLEHPAVQDAAVIGLRDETGDEIIRAYVTLKESQTTDRAELLKLCRSRLANYKWPRDLEIRKELPKNTLGKVLKHQLRQEAQTSL